MGLRAYKHMFVVPLSGGGGSTLPRKPVSYNDLHKIKPYRFVAIDNAVQQFKKTFQIQEIPIDCVTLVVKINREGKMRIRFRSSPDLPSGVWARTIYIPAMDYYFVNVNACLIRDPKTGRSRYPYAHSSDRGLNFTIAHEFGHIFLGHAQIADAFKNATLLAEEDAEANEFAGRLLMPKRSIETCNFCSVAEVAAQYMVSEQAVLKRLSHLGRHDKRMSKPGHACPNCESPDIQECFDFCPTCGIPLIDRMGVLTMQYFDGYATDEYGAVPVCPRCNNSELDEREEYCQQCGQYLRNTCTNQFCDMEAYLEGNARYCFACGASTTFLTSGLLADWEDARQALIKIAEWEEGLCGLGNAPKLLDGVWYDALGTIRRTANPLLADLLEGSKAKLHEKHLILIARTEEKKQLLQERYDDVLLRFIKMAMGEDYAIDDISLASFEEFLPKRASEPEDYEVPF